MGLGTGAFAEYVVVDASQAVAIAKDMPFAPASLIGCAVVTGIGAVVNTAGVTAGKSVGGHRHRRRRSQQHPGRGTRRRLADHRHRRVADEAEGSQALRRDPWRSLPRADVAKEVKALTDGRGADYVFVTVGAKAVIEQAFKLARRRGSVVLVGMPASGTSATFDPVYLAYDEQRIIGSRMGSTRAADRRAQDRGTLQAGPGEAGRAGDRTYPLSQINEAMDAVVQGKALRNVIVF